MCGYTLSEEGGKIRDQGGGGSRIAANSQRLQKVGHANVPDDGVLDLLAGHHSRKLIPEQRASGSMPLEKAAQGERLPLCFTLLSGSQSVLPHAPPCS